MCLRSEYHLVRSKATYYIKLIIIRIKILEYQNVAHYLKIFIQLIIDNNAKTILLKMAR